MAQTPPLPPIRTLALPDGTFPREAHVTHVRADNRQADATTRIHTVSLAQLGRLDGYLQTATWGSGRGFVTLRYSASIFQSPSQAANARSDALASLWEVGRPVRLGGVMSFQIVERDGHTDIVTVAQEGVVEFELELRWHGRTPRASAVRTLRRAVLRATQNAQRYAAQLPVAAPVLEDPAVFVAPWGTGPVVQSPSLLIPADSPDILFDRGAYRDAAPAMAQRVHRHTAMVPAGALSRFVRTAMMEGQQIYTSVALYADDPSAEQAFQHLAAANEVKSWLHRQAPLGSAGIQATKMIAWHGHGETVVLALDQNVLVVAAAENPLPVGFDPLLAGILARVPSWLQVQGTQIVDQAGTAVRLTGLNWYGAESPDFVTGGLEYQPYETILSTIAHSGYNVIRLPFSNQLVEQNPIVTQHLAANPDLVGLHALDILDRIVGYAGALGLRVILDNHRSDAGWSSQESGLWYTPDYPDTSFQRDWVTLAQRYAVNNVVIGADLRNEPHGTAAWGGGDPTTDWLAAAERAGNGILAVNPHLLIVVEGVERYGPDGYWWGGNLMGVATNPVVLQFADGTSARSRLVYSAHDYGPDNCGAGCPWFNSQTTYQSLSRLWEEHWGYITADPAAPYAAPVWVGEFGTCNYNPTCGANALPGSQGQWFSSLVRYLGEKQLGWAYWSVNGSQSTGPNRVYGALEWYGFLSRDWSLPTSWLAQMLASIQGNAAGST